jgi:hypothetical protein
MSAVIHTVLNDFVIVVHACHGSPMLEVIKVPRLDKWIMEFKPANGRKELSDVD